MRLLSIAVPVVLAGIPHLHYPVQIEDAVAPTEAALFQHQFGTIFATEALSSLPKHGGATLKGIRQCATLFFTGLLGSRDDWPLIAARNALLVVYQLPPAV